MKSKLLVIIPVTLVLVLAGTVTSMFPHGEQSALEANIQATTEELEGLRFYNVQLEAEARALTGPSEIEKVAREELGYVFPGEIPYVVVEIEGEDEIPRPEVEEVLTPADPWYSRIVDFLTGRDVGAPA